MLKQCTSSRFWPSLHDWDVVHDKFLRYYCLLRGCYRKFFSLRLLVLWLKWFFLKFLNRTNWTVFEISQIFCNANTPLHLLHEHIHIHDSGNPTFAFEVGILGILQCLEAWKIWNQLNLRTIWAQFQSITTLKCWIMRMTTSAYLMHAFVFRLSPLRNIGQQQLTETERSCQYIEICPLSTWTTRHFL